MSGNVLSNYRREALLELLEEVFRQRLSHDARALLPTLAKEVQRLPQEFRLGIERRFGLFIDRPNLGAKIPPDNSHTTDTAIKIALLKLRHVLDADDARVRRLLAVKADRDRPER